MIVINLSCSQGHRFDGWFSSNDEFQRQLDGGEIVCPFCADHTVTRLPAAPGIRRHGRSPGRDEDEKQRSVASFSGLARAVARLMEESEDVGDRFASEARRIHREEAPARSIRGRSTAAEAAELLDEGIPVLPLPIPPTGEMH